MISPHAPYPVPGYPPPAPMARQWPVPTGRVVPAAWAITLSVITVLAVGLMFLGPHGATLIAPLADNATLYHSSLAQDDGSWSLKQNSGGACSYANGGLDAISSGAATTMALSALCLLKNQDAGDLHLSVRLLAPIQLSNPLHAAIFVHSSVAFLFDSLGEITIAVFDPDREEWQQIAGGIIFTDEMHTADTASNTLDILVQGDTYTVGVNGVSVFQQTLAGVPATGTIALGTYTTTTASQGEALYADFQLGTA